MADLLLYMAPGSCSRVSLTALLETGADFETSLVRFMKGDHKSPAFRQLNPKSKVPLLIADGQALSENVAILFHLNRLYPNAHLMPKAASAIEEARQLADLCFCSATLHPIVTRLRLPKLVAGPDAAQAVWDKACAVMRDHFQLIENRLSIVDKGYPQFD